MVGAAEGGGTTTGATPGAAEVISTPEAAACLTCSSCAARLSCLSSSAVRMPPFASFSVRSSVEGFSFAEGAFASEEYAPSPNVPKR